MEGIGGRRKRKRGGGEGERERGNTVAAVSPSSLFPELRDSRAQLSFDVSDERRN